mmetsp:Transcript_11717/g.29876  ORF Transcript_11717/g.29876 Transcript_11717/m.29876 type:complete len:290 (+) Transcript_11717:1757-2626(+)
MDKHEVVHLEEGPERAVHIRVPGLCYLGAQLYNGCWGFHSSGRSINRIVARRWVTLGSSISGCCSSGRGGGFVVLVPLLRELEVESDGGSNVCKGQRGRDEDHHAHAQPSPLGLHGGCVVPVLLAREQKVLRPKGLIRKATGPCGTRPPQAPVRHVFLLPSRVSSKRVGSTLRRAPAAPCFSKDFRSKQTPTAVAPSEVPHTSVFFRFVSFFFVLFRFFSVFCAEKASARALFPSESHRIPWARMAMRRQRRKTKSVAFDPAEARFVSEWHDHMRLRLRDRRSASRSWA